MDASELVRTAVQKLKQGQLDEAIEDLKKAVQANSSGSQAHNYLGIAYAQKGLKEQAIAELQRACALDPASPLVQFNLGMVYMDCGRTVEAESCFRYALSLDPNYQRAKDALAKLKGPGAPAPVQYLSGVEVCPLCKVSLPADQLPSRCHFCGFDFTPIFRSYFVRDTSLPGSHRYVCSVCQVEIVDFRAGCCIACGLDWKTGLGPEGEQLLQTSSPTIKQEEEPKKAGLKGLFAKIRKHS